MKGFKYRMAVRLLEFATRVQWVGLMHFSDRLRRSTMGECI